MNQRAVMPRPAAPVDGQSRHTSGIQLVCWVGLLSILVLLRDLAGVGMPDIIISGACALAFFLLDVGPGLGLYMFTSALTLPHNEIRIFYVLILCLKLIRSRQLRLHSGMLLLSIGMLLLQLLDMALFSSMGLTSLIYDYVTRMLFLLLPLLWYSTHISARHYRHALLCYAWGCLLGATIVFILTIRTQGLLSLMSGSGAFTRLGKTGTADMSGMQTTYNANQLGTMMALVIALCLCLMDQHRLPKLIGFPVIVYALVIILLTRSRTSLLITAGAAAIYYWVIVIRRKQLLRGLIIFLAMLLILALVFALFPGIVEATLNRFVDQKDITNGRSDLLQLYLTEWFGNPWCFLFGYGIGSYADVVTHAGNSPHNSISDILISWGITGLFIIVGVLWLCYRQSRRAIPRSQRILAYLPALLAIIATLGGQYLTTGYSHMRTCFLLLAARGLVVSAPQKGQNL